MMSYVEDIFVGNKEIYPRSIAFNTDGEKMYFPGYINDNIYQYALTALPAPEVNVIFFSTPY